jgi:tRNA A-37 threonylcarbamoyl transferase component Bud32
MNTASRVGRRVGARFVVEQELGAGGMGSIYRGRDERLGEPVAIKFLKQSLLQDPVLRERFRREALSLARLRHPGIVTVLDFGEMEGELYTVLELVRGKTLEELRSESAEPFHVLRAGSIFDQILAALDTCHEQDIVHRDMKPSNVMVSTDRGVDETPGGGSRGSAAGGTRDHVKLIDFGLARIGTDTIDKLTETGTVQGTPHYMAPEQCRGEEVGAPADIYAIGVVFYELLTGSAPFQGNDAATFMAQHLFVEPAPLRQLAPNVSPGIAAAVHHALAKRPEDRPTASALRSALASAFKGSDPETLAEAAATERRRVGGLPRHERAVTRPADPALRELGRGTEGRAVSARAHQGSTIVVWMPNDDRSAALRGCLGTAGFACSLWTEDSLPDLDSVGALVLSAKDVARIGSLRAIAPKLPVIVVDVATPHETTASIRAGANDMVLRAAPDADIVQKLRRLLRGRAK